MKNLLLIITLPHFFVLCIPAHMLYAAPADSTVRWLDRDTVVSTVAGSEILSIQKDEERFGLTDDIGKLLVLRPGVNRIPEAGSSLLVNGEGPFDNRFVVCGVPVFSASHFSNHVYADVSGLTIATLKHVQLVTKRLAGRYGDATGAVIELDPGIYRPADARWKARPELVVDAGTFNQDVSLSLPFRDNDYYQLTINHSRDYIADWIPASRQKIGDPALFGYAVPASFFDFTFSGTSAINDALLSQYAWLALDNYDGRSEPWGAGALTLDGGGAMRGWKAIAGGSHQHYYDGKRLGWSLPLKQVTRSNVSAALEANNLQAGPFGLVLTFRGQYLDWNGSLQQKVSAVDTASYLLENGSIYYRYNDMFKTVSSYEQGREAEASLHAGISRWPGLFGYGLDVLAVAVFPNPILIADPGIWCKLGIHRLNLDAGGGIQSSRPDIRGLPDDSYRNEVSRTYRSWIGADWVLSSWSDVHIEGYLKYKDRCSRQPDIPGELRWDRESATPLFARGVNLEWTATAVGIFSATLIQNLGRSQRLVDNELTSYEWDMPWSTRLVLALKNTDKTVGLFITGVACAGLPYRDIALRNDKIVFDTLWQRIPLYRRIDMKLQFTQPMEYNRYVTRFDLYIDFPNISDFFEGLFVRFPSMWGNTRDYYWDESFVKYPIELQPYSVSIGLRLAFRL